MKIETIKELDFDISSIESTKLAVNSSTFSRINPILAPVYTANLFSMAKWLFVCATFACGILWLLNHIFNSKSSDAENKKIILVFFHLCVLALIFKMVDIIVDRTDTYIEAKYQSYIIIGIIVAYTAIVALVKYIKNRQK